jgi:hypothetical protein
VAAVGGLALKQFLAHFSKVSRSQAQRKRALTRMPSPFLRGPVTQRLVMNLGVTVDAQTEQEQAVMNSQELKQRIDKIEQCADEAERAVQAGSAPSDLRQCVEQLHQQAKQAKQAGSADESSMRQQVMQMEQTADRAKQACSSAGGQIDPKTQQAVMQAHSEVSNLKKQLQQG